MQEKNQIWDRRGTLVALYAAIFCMAPLLSNRIVEILGLKFLVGALAMTFALGILDVINEIWGMKAARQAVLTAMVVRILLWGFVALSFTLPTFMEAAGYTKIVTQSLRILVAGEAAIFISQYFIDVHLFAFLKGYFKAGFWLRYNLSNAISVCISAALFIILAFGGTDKPIFSLILGIWALRILLSLTFTPIFYGVIKLCREKEEKIIPMPMPWGI